jgi:Tfp pilus assembly protein PilF
MMEQDVGIVRAETDPEALAAADRVIEIAPRWAQPWHVKADIYRAMGKTQEAQASDTKFDRMT